VHATDRVPLNTVLVSDDIFSLPPEGIREVKVLKTFVGGKMTYNASDNKNSSDEVGNR